MLYIHYVLLVKERAGISTDLNAEQAIFSVFESMSDFIRIEQAEELAETLPLEIRQCLTGDLWPKPFELNEFITRIGDKEGLDPETAVRHARAVLSVLAEYLPSVALIDILDRIPKDMIGLFLWVNQAA